MTNARRVFGICLVLDLVLSGLGHAQGRPIELGMGRDAEAWDNGDDCVTLRAPNCTIVNRFQFYSDCANQA